MSGYLYRPLNTELAEIRLLYFEPDSHVAPEARVRCRIEHVSLSNPLKHKYVAISYSWGKAPPLPEIELDGQLVRVPPSTEAALRGAFSRSLARQPDFQTPVWIDFICINQEDNAEKNSQVRLMRRIYQNAQRTIIWLGVASDNSDEALDLVKPINDAAFRESMSGEKWYLYELRHDHRWGLPISVDPIWYELAVVLKRDWFRRVWIIQELAVSPKAIIVCGTREVEWESIANAIKFLITPDRFGQSLGVNALSLFLTLDEQRRLFQEGNQFNLMYQLGGNRRALATDPRDHLFAFYGFFETGSLGHSVTRPRYESSCEEVYTQAAIQLLQHQRSLDIFSMIRVQKTSSNEDLQGLASWVPDWSAGHYTEPFLWREWDPHFGPELKCCYMASGDSSYTINLDGTKKKLRIEGWAIDAIAATGKVLDEIMDRVLMDDTDEMVRSILQTQRIMRTWEQTLGSRMRYVTGEFLLDAYCETLLGGCTNGDAGAMNAAFYGWLKSMMPYVLLCALGLDRVWLVKMIFKSMWYIQYLLDYYLGLAYPKWRLFKPHANAFPKAAPLIYYRRLARTEENLIGLAPPLTEPGDIIALSKGSKLPLVLRPKSGDAELACEWELIGDTYIHGIMDGDIWNMLEGQIEPSGPIWDLYKERSHRKVFWLV